MTHPFRAVGAVGWRRMSCFGNGRALGGPHAGRCPYARSFRGPNDSRPSMSDGTFSVSGMIGHIYSYYAMRLP